ncbi:iron complex transport system substrate-binding protein [Clostridium tetanomorphum]|uniref:ABC transporter substrate-binding protein n=1 Tax=Clostridium tetanomorphum TaxID=1553 RepID=A0A923ECD5_CLOTT|nr:ABC transporter substrate-binding protein [Clostridium tetanomorphum]KAJ52360.1 ferrichrome-binding periplasmic protein [Clostridium tetanomorphum DSM 665]MBC2397880.1 ABC transporter substrate-binding protein [Clostridium tetanomorphum]MBP1864805.1 iron complex transport system substrate-binding protein [Clostridium tetanomorphum]NRS83981.1 iron complex transport system substrate-binding protein [Clostridium tetanomorphum]NRZ97199.1 iron complex transport system substrate-binding protein [
MKKLLSIFICGMLMVTLFGCAEKPKQDKNSDSKQVNQEKISKNKSDKIKYATKFNVEYLDNNVKLVTDGANRKLLLVPKGQKKPEGYDKIPVINTPIDNVLLCSSVHSSLIRPLDVFDTVKCVTKYDVDQGHIDEINDRMKKGSITYVGKLAALDYELIKSKKPEVAFIISVDEPKVGPKLKELGIPYVVEASSLENHPLGRMEWIKFMSIFYNKKDVADKYLQKAEDTIKRIGEKIKEKDKPLVTAGVSYKGKFSVRRGGSYQAKMYDIVGGNYVFKDVESNKSGAFSMTFEDFYAKSINSDIYIYAESSKIPKSITDFEKQVPIIKNMKSIKNGQLWATQPWWSQSVDKLDEIMEDLAAICHPEEFKDHKIKHYYKVPKTSDK